MLALIGGACSDWTFLLWLEMLTLVGGAGLPVHGLQNPEL